MAAVAQPVDQVSDMLQGLKVDTAKIPGENNAEAPPSQDGNSSDGSADATASGGTGDAASNNGAQEGVHEPPVFFPNGYPHSYVYQEYHQPGDWEEYPRFVGVDGVEIPQGVYGGDSGSPIIYHPGYGLPAYGPYNTGAPIPTMGADGILYGQQAFSYPGHMHQQPVSPGGQYISTPTSLAGDPPALGPGEPGPPGVESGNGSAGNGNVSVGPRPGYPVTLIPSHGPYARGVLPLTMHNTQDIRNFEGLRAGAQSWPDVTKISEGQQRPGVNAMHVVSQPLPASGLPSQGMRPLVPLQAHMTLSQRSTPAPGALGRGYPPLGRVMSNSNGSGRGGRGMPCTTLDSRSNGGRGWMGVDQKGKPRGGRGAGFLANGNGNLDILNEQNRGPRTARIRNQRTTQGVLRHSRGPVAGSNGSNEVLSALINREQYNRPDFVTRYEQAKFFVIKSYSEDDVHKSIKYNVWASTPNGNKRLDGAYQDALSRQGQCPVFLFFSVNASGQFCGVAEMTGPVDFKTNMDFWQQDKWNGRFPVKWHVIKDIPNCQFRHIILENNDNKPVTNSRDTQEVKFEQGSEMLNIFKNYSSKLSILDDFQFYEARQRHIQDKRAKHQAQQLRELQRQQGAGRPGNEPDLGRSQLQPTPAESLQQLQQSKAGHKQDKVAETSVEDSTHSKAGVPSDKAVNCNNHAVEGAPNPTTPSLQRKSSSKTTKVEVKEETAVAPGPPEVKDSRPTEDFKENVVAADNVVDEKIVQEQKPSSLG